MGRRRREREYRDDDKLGPVVVCRPLEVTVKECHGDTTRMIKRFCKKVRKEEVLKPFYRQLMYWETKSQKRRRRKSKSEYECKKKIRLSEEEDVKLER